MRSVSGGDRTKLLWVVDSGLCWIWHLASRLGLGLDVGSLGRLQIGVDFIAFALAAALGWRLHGPLAGALAALFYGLNIQIAEGTVLLGYYYWSIPAALVLAHVVAVDAGSESRKGRVIRFVQWVLSSVTAGLFLWLRVLWLPVAVIGGAVWATCAFRQRWKALVLALAVIAFSYGIAAARVARETGLSMTQSRSQLWHTLYIGLGYYGNFGAIRWLDGYAFALGHAAGHDPRRDPLGYDRYMRKLFLAEVRSAPVKYAATIVRRVAGYLQYALSSLTERIGDGVLTGLVAVCFAFGIRRAWTGRAFRRIATFYAITVVVWALLLPPQPNYALETMGLVCPLGGVLLAAAAEVIGFRKTAGDSGAGLRSPLE